MGGQKGGLWVWSSVSGDDFGLWKFLSTFFCQKLKGGEGKRWIVGLCDFSISLFLFIFRFFIIPEKNSGTAAFSFCYPLRNQKRGDIITSCFSPLSSDDRLSVDCEEMKALSKLFFHENTMREVMIVMFGRAYFPSDQIFIKTPCSR
ncbi:hypothetical protein CCHR01_19730 [Colletotrichum chrysophilum]|uniref:Uncharacterized protein n=1 Tax=Colletotrichum chrysophilum TaxID=1836956 RepID=A0AAD9E7L0_9PEZI|nr:hypothetical protein CCHR01_19730 [Colletotrichum chrysophilum]